MAQICKLVMAAVVMLGNVAAHADPQAFGDYDVYQNIFTTDFLQPGVARAYGVTRANDHALINISVRKRLPTGGDEAVAASVSGTLGDLIHKHELEFREIVEQGAIYYIAEFEFINEETLYFDIKVTPASETATFKLDFQKKLYVGE